MFLIGGIMTATLLFKTINGTPYWCSVIIDLVAMLGSGVVCSALVSLLIEIQNNSRANNVLRDQRDFILKSAKNKLIRLYEMELKNLSLYYTSNILNQKKNWKKEELTISEIGARLVFLTDKINTAEAENISADMLTIDADYDRREKNRYRLLVEENLAYYELLHQALLDLSNNSHTYLLAGIFTEDRIENIDFLASQVHNVISFSSENGLEELLVLDFKRMFFEDTKDILEFLEISDNIKSGCHYKDFYNN